MKLRDSDGLTFDDVLLVPQRSAIVSRSAVNTSARLTRRITLNIPIVSQLMPFQRFVLALMLFLNVSVLGCLFLMVMEKISLVR